MLEDLSGNGTYVNDAMVGRNKRRELNDGDEISVLDVARFIFRYPRLNEADSNGFRQQYSIDTVLGKGHFATVYLCTEKSTGMRHAVKHFERRTRGPNSAAEEKSKVDGLQQEVAVLMGVSHPNVVCLKDTFNERDGVYLILELAPEGELFNCIVSRQKLTEPDSRKVFMQLFKGVKYLVSTLYLCLLSYSADNLARSQYRTSRHKTREHTAYRRRPDRQDRRLWSRKNHRRRVIHLDIVRYAFLCRARNTRVRQSSAVHTSCRCLVPRSRPLHLPVWVSAVQR